jgi:hypothetical protein
VSTDQDSGLLTNQDGPVRIAIMRVNLGAAFRRLERHVRVERINLIGRSVAKAFLITYKAPKQCGREQQDGGHEWHHSWRGDLHAE